MTPSQMLVLVLFTVLLGVLPARNHPQTAAAWEQADYEIFDLVDEVEKVAGVNENFYTLLEIEPNANSKDISRGYRKQSLLWHPDKNDSPQAPKRQKLIGVVTAILRDEESRKRYDFFLRNGVPRWRGTGYYYRRHRPGLGWVLVGLTMFVSLLQYLGAWVLCLRRRSMFREILAEEVEVAIRRTPRRTMKKTLSKELIADDSASESSGHSTPQLSTAEELLLAATRDPMNDPVVQFPSPSAKDVLIIQLPRAVLRAVVSLPSSLADLARGRRKNKKGDHDDRSDSEGEDDTGSARKRKAKDPRKHAAGDDATADAAPRKRHGAAGRRLANRRPVNPKFVPPTVS